MDIIKCKICGKELEKNQKFCDGCGAELDVQKTCTKCGALLKEESKFCPKCGSPVIKDQIDSNILSNNPSISKDSVSNEKGNEQTGGNKAVSKGFPKFIIGILAVVVIAVAGFFMMQSSKPVYVGDFYGLMEYYSQSRYAADRKYTGKLVEIEIPSGILDVLHEKTWDNIYLIDFIVTADYEYNWDKRIALAGIFYADKNYPATIQDLKKTQERLTSKGNMIETIHRNQVAPPCV